MILSKTKALILTAAVVLAGVFSPTMAQTMEGSCTCTDVRGVTCDPKSRFILAEYFRDENGEIWHCNEGKCTATGVYQG